MKLQSGSPAPTETWWTEHGEQSTAVPAPGSRANILTFEIKGSTSALAGKHTDFDRLMDELESDPKNSQDLAEAGTWVARTFYPGDRTIRTARLEKGLSQKKLAVLLGTSQPHVATMEKGCVDLMMSTAIKLCAILEIEMNELPEMLDRQKSITESKGKK